MTSLAWKKYYPLSDKNAFICLVDVMGDDSSIVQAARVSYGKDEQEPIEPYIAGDKFRLNPEYSNYIKNKNQKDRQLIRYLMAHSHTTPFEMVEFKLMLQIPMDAWRQMIRHRTANVNEYSTRYTEALDMQQATLPGEWRLQSTYNKQGSSGFLQEWPEGWEYSSYNNHHCVTTPEGAISIPKSPYPPGEYLTDKENFFHAQARELYEERLALGVAKEQARKDLPLSTYTRAYWKCDLHNIFNFLRLRMDSHAQLEIRSFANCMFEIIKQVCPVACEAFEDYVLHAKKFSRMEMEVLKTFALSNDWMFAAMNEQIDKPGAMTDREWKEFLNKLS